MANKADLVKKIQRMFGGKAEVQETINPDTPILQPNRRDKRRMKQYGAIKGNGAIHDVLRSAAFRGRKKTGQPQWFRVMQYDAARRKSLEKIDLLRLEPAVGPVVQDLYYAGGYKTVWQLTQVEDVNELLHIGRNAELAHGVSINELKRLWLYLIQQRVPVKWSI